MDLTLRTSPSSQSALDARCQAQKEAASRIYSPLYDWQTRVILLQLAATFTEPLVAQLCTVELLHGPGVVLAAGKRRRIGYTALSYCWGPPDFQKEIQLDGRRYSIALSLFTALLFLRNEKTPLTMWIDALSINQWDAEERSMQIINMLTIFSKASEVIAWIGVGSSNIAEAMKNPRDGGTCSDTSTKPGLRELFQTSFFRRVWIKQEVFAAVKLYVQCGSDRLPWEALERRDFMRRTIEIRSEIEEGEKQNIYLRESHKGGKQTDIINVLRSTSQSDASDSRDFVYGVLGMSRTILKNNLESEQSAVSLPVDYNRNVAQVFGDVARYIMRRDECLNVLLLKGGFGETADEVKLPSWVPDWRTYLSPHPWLSYATSKSGSPTWRWNEYTGCADEECPFVEQANDMILCVQGLVLGSIKATDSEQLEGLRYVWQLNEDERTAEKLLHRDQTDMLFWKYHKALVHFKDVVDRQLLRYAAKAPTDWPKKGRSLEIPVFAESEPDGFDSSVTLLIPAKRVSLRQCILLVVGSPELYDDTNEGAAPPKLKETKLIEMSAGNVRSKRSLYDADDQPLGQSNESDFRKQTTQPIDGHGRSGMWPLLESRPEDLMPLHWAVPRKAETNDGIVLLKGGIPPMVLRPVPKGSSYRLVGPAALTQWAFRSPKGALLRHIDHYLWTDREDQYLFLLRLLDLHQMNGTLETFNLV